MGILKPGNNIIPNSGFPRRMWGGGDIVFFKPLEIGDVYREKLLWRILNTKLVAVENFV